MEEWTFLRICPFLPGYLFYYHIAKSLQSCPTLCDPIDSSHQAPRPWDSLGKNTGVGCHFLLQCTKVKSESEVAQSCPTLSDPMDCSPPGSSIHGIFQARVLEWGAIAFSIIFVLVSPKLEKIRPTVKYILELKNRNGRVKWSTLNYGSQVFNILFRRCTACVT